MRHNLDLAVAKVGDRHSVAKVAGTAVDFDALLEEGSEGGGVEDAVRGWLGGVDRVLGRVSIAVSWLGLDSE
jgi:hypothetical protein